MVSAPSAVAAREFLRGLFWDAKPGERINVRFLGASGTRSSNGGRLVAIDPADPEIPEPGPREAPYYMVSYSGPAGELERTTFVWSDVDGRDWPGRFPGPRHLEPSGVMLSGKPKPLAYHMHWILGHSVPIKHALRLATLAALAFGGDLAVCDNEKRMMRIPGYPNFKPEYKQADGTWPLSRMIDWQPERTFDADDLEAMLVGQLVAEHTAPHTGHALAMALGAILGRAKWTAERITATVNYWCAEQDVDPMSQRDRVTAAVGTLARREQGILVSAAELREALGDKWTKFIKALGIGASNGDLILGDEAIGKVQTVERDIGEYVVSTGEWAWADGTLARWAKTHWELTSESTLLSSVFSVLARLKTQTDGVEEEYVPTHKVARAIQAVSTGRLASMPLAKLSASLIPLSNGVFNTTTGELLPHGKEHRNRWILPVSFDPAARCPEWLRFLAEAAPEAEVRAFLQKWFGYCLVYGNPKHWMLWLFGPSGTGKSTVLKVLLALFGPSAVAVSADDLGEYRLAQLSDARLAVSSELSNRTLKTALLKGIVSGDALTGRHPYGKPFTFSFEGKLVMASNALPPVDQSEGMWRRLVVLSFAVVPAVKDEKLIDKLRGELSGIFNWALEGLRLVSADPETWALPQSVVDLVEEYHDSADPYSQFVEDEIVLEEDGFAEQKPLYNRYRDWCEDRGLKPDPLGPIWMQELRRRGIRPVEVIVDGHAVRKWQGGALVGASLS